MRAKRAVAVLLFALVVYFVLIGYRGVYLVQQHAIGLKVLGVAVLVLPLIGVYVVVAELRFGLATERLAHRLDDDPVGAGPADGGPADVDDAPLPRTPSGRIDRAAADARFELRRADVQAEPDDWRRWYRLALAYDDAGDRKRAREAMRTAIARADTMT